MPPFSRALASSITKSVIHLPANLPLTLRMTCERYFGVTHRRSAILIAGVIAFVEMPKLEDPAVSAKQAMVVVAMPGASAHEMELTVAQTVEDELRTLPDVNKVKTECRNGTAMFTVEFQMTVLNTELEQHFDLLRRKANDVALKLPQGCSAPIVIDDMMDVYGIFYALVEAQTQQKIYETEYLRATGQL